MKFIDLLEEAKADIEAEKREFAKEEIKERLREIDAAEKTLKRMRLSLEKLLDNEVE